jgi:hypothetical protein
MAGLPWLPWLRVDGSDWDWPVSTVGNWSRTAEFRTAMIKIK